jgi:outer membrane protein assembly factor BamB
MTLPIAASSARARRVALLCVAAAVALPGGAARADASKWKQYGANGDQSNDNRGETLLTPANVATLVPVWTGRPWQVPADLPAMQHGAFYGTSRKLGLSAFSQTRGTEKWSLPDAESTCTPALSPDARVMTYAFRYAGDFHGEGALVGVDADTGAQLWAQQISAIGEGCTSVIGNMVVVATSKGWTQSYDVADGSTAHGTSLVKFTFPIDLHVAGQGRWYYVVGTTVRRVYQVDGRTKSEKSPDGWNAPLGTLTDGTAATPRIAGTALVVSDSAGGVYALELATGAPRWSVALPTAEGTVAGVTATSDAIAYAAARPAGADADAIEALGVDAGGAVLWTAPLAAAQLVQSNLAIADGMVFAGIGPATCTTLAVFDAATGTPVASLPTGMPDAGDAGRCDLAVANGRVVLHGKTATGPTMQVLGLPG